MAALAARLVRDPAADRRKTALLAASSLVGLCCWGPPLWRAANGGSLITADAGVRVSGAKADGSPDSSSGESRNVDATRPTLQGTAVGPGRRFARIDGIACTEGATVGGRWTVLAIEPRRVLLGGDGGAVELTIDAARATEAGAR